MTDYPNLINELRRLDWHIPIAAADAIETLLVERGALIERIGQMREDCDNLAEREAVAKEAKDCNNQLLEAIIDCKRLDRLLKEVIKERDAALADARRYKYLREHMNYIDGIEEQGGLSWYIRSWHHDCNDFNHDTLNAHVDAATQESSDD